MQGNLQAQGWSKTHHFISTQDQPSILIMPAMSFIQGFPSVCIKHFTHMIPIYLELNRVRHKTFLISLFSALGSQTKYQDDNKWGGKRLETCFQSFWKLNLLIQFSKGLIKRRSLFGEIPYKATLESSLKLQFLLPQSPICWHYRIAQHLCLGPSLWFENSLWELLHYLTCATICVRRLAMKCGVWLLWIWILSLTPPKWLISERKCSFFKQFHHFKCNNKSILNNKFDVTVVGCLV